MKKLYQQRRKLDERSDRYEHRVMNLAPAHVRPVVRGKFGARTEFGAKLTAGVGNGFYRIKRFLRKPDAKVKSLKER